ncbi:rho GTPase-activating protein 33 isoform X2 [Hypomesus transpacificus]|uniref:rho GTPase-activating protein 33 isoform X2 n=1 Tax=Hypomesus transpacificus TaxID=137520 RepID=UPI001F07606C|nr:rho GTPase-activating protein 33 isoform X2 [Hypomesus transpacificus]
MVARSTDNLESSGEPTTRSVGTTANLKGKMNKRLSIVKGHFPKLVDCAHFHYENVEFGSIELQFASEQSDANWSSGSAKDMVFLVQVSCQGKTWMVRRSYEEFRTLDAHLHQCIYDRRYSQLLPLPAIHEIGDRLEIFTPLLSEYLSRLSMIVDNKLNCGPVLTWMEIDNRGNRFLLKEEASLNVPAIAAAHVTKRYNAQASDEISIEVGDILSVIDMPPKEDTSWWRGKHGFQVGFFPSECVELINEKLPQSVNPSAAKTDADPVSSKPATSSSPGPPSPTSVSKKHGKLIGFLRTFMKSRPSKQKLKQRGILKERVFGCDLGEHLLNSGLDVPQVLKSCSEFIEQHGVVDGIYRHSGVSSNIQKLRHEFDSENVPDLTKDMYMQDIHCVGSLCKLYFRELPNPLLTYQLYDKFADCMGELTDDERMVKVHDVIQQLPPPHYRTLEYLFKHLAHLATCSGETNMHIKNLAIVWAPNLLRSMEIEAVGLSGADPFKEVRIQSVVVEFLLSNVNVLFSDSFTSVGRFSVGRQSLSRPKSFVSTRLLSLEEAQARTQAPLQLQGTPLSLQGQYHTVLDLPVDRRKREIKRGKAGGGSWKTFFAIGKPMGAGRRKPMRISSLFQPTTSHAGCRVDSVTLRSAKSEESLSSQHSGAGQSKAQRLRRPRSSSDGLSLASAMDPQLLPQRPPSRLPSSRSYDSLLPDDRPRPGEEGDDEDEEDDEDKEGVYMLPDLSRTDPAPSWHDEDVIDFSPTFLEDGPIGVASTRDSPPTASPPPYRCLSHHGHASSSGQRSVTEDPDSVLTQSEATARRSLILAATAPPLQVFCQHRPSNSSPAATQSVETTNQSPSHGQAQPNSAPAAQPPPERRSFTRKVVNALSTKAPKSPPLDISDPIAISVPAKVLEMIGGRAGELPTSAPPSGPPQPPQMISMLLRSCDFQLSESCQQEIRSKLGPPPDNRVRVIPGPTGAPLPSQQPPPPPPKNPARLMALALAESANKALRQGATPPYRPPQPRTQDPPDPRYKRSLSADTGELLASDPNQLYSTVRPLSVWMNQGTADTTETGHTQEDKTPGQDTGTLSSETSVSDSVASELSAGSSSGEDHTPSPVYTNQSQASRPSPAQAQPHRKPPAYSRQFSAPHLQQKSTSTPTSSQPPSAQPPPQLQLIHSKSESSPLSQVKSFQPTRPKVPPKPLDLAVQRDQPPQRPLLAKSDLRRSLDSGRVRRMFSQPQGNPPLARAYSERHSGPPDMLARYYAARTAGQPAPGPQPPTPPQQAHIRPVPPSSSDDPGKGENFYYEIAGPEPPQGPPSYARHSYQNMRLDLEGNFRPTPQHAHPDPSSRPLSRGHQQPQPPYPGAQRLPQLWSSEATRAWAAAHSHSHSQSFSHGHTHQRSHEGPRPRPQRQSSSSVRQARSEVHPLPSSSIVPLSVHQRSPQLRQPDVTASQLHPYFENGRVCYRPQSEDPPLTAQHPQTDRQAGTELTEPVYVNYPYTCPAPHPLTPRPDPLPPPSDLSTRGWATTNLDNTTQATTSDPLSEGQEEPAQPSSEKGGSTSLSPISPDSPAAQMDQTHGFSPPLGLEGQSGQFLPASTASPGAHYRSRSDPQSSSNHEPRMEGRVNVPVEGPQCLSGKDIASLLIEKLVEEERADRVDPSSNMTSSSASSSSSPQLDHPANPYSHHPSQPPPAYNVYTPGPSRSRASVGGAGGGFHRQDPLRRSSSGGQYRQAYDVMPSGDQVLKFYRSTDLTQGDVPTPSPNPYPPRQQYPEPPYPSRSSYPFAPQPITSPSAALAGLSLGGPRAFPPQYPFQPGPVLGQYPNAPHRDLTPDSSQRPPGLRNQRGLARQGSLPGPNWTIHTEGQTRSYC